METLSDSQLVTATLKGNRSAFGVLSERYREMVLRLAYRTIGQSDIAHDLTQEALLQAFLSLGQLRDSSRFRSWLYGISLNVCYDFLRKQRANLVSFESLAGGVYIADDMPSPETIAEQLDLRQTIQSAINGLTEANRSAVMLYYYEGFSIRDVADVLDISVSAVKVRLHSARQHLKIHLSALLPIVEPVHTTQGEMQMFPVIVADVMSQSYKAPDGNEFYNYQVLLFDEASRRALVIWIGELEAITIAMGISFKQSNQRPFKRPMTQEFIMNLVKATDATITAIELSKLENDVFYATVKLKTDSGTEREVDARPSDALGLAVWHDVPIFASKQVWEKASPPISEGLSAPQKGIQKILKRLDMEGESRTSWVQLAKERAAEDEQDPDEVLRQTARGIIDEAFE